MSLGLSWRLVAARRFSPRCGLAVLLLFAAVVPVWANWHVNPLEATVHYGFLWESLQRIPVTAREVGLVRAITHFQSDNLACGAILFVIGSTAGKAILDGV